MLSKKVKTYHGKCRKNTEKSNICKTKYVRLVMKSRCAECEIKKSRFAKEQETKGLLTSLGLKHIQNGHFWGCSKMLTGWGGTWGKKAPLPKICHTYPIMMKLGTVIPYFKKIQKIHESCDTSPNVC